MFDPTQIGKRIRTIRGSRNQRVFADEYNITQAKISKMENGKDITLDFLFDISEKENVSLDYLVKGRTEETTIQTNTKKDIPLKMSDSQVDYLRLYQSDTLPNIVLDALFSEEGSNVIGTLAYILNEWINIYHENELEGYKYSHLDIVNKPIDTKYPIQHSYDTNKARLLFTYSEGNILEVIKSFLFNLFDVYKDQNYKTSSVYVFNGCLELIQREDIRIHHLCNNFSLIYLLFKGFHHYFEEIINKAIANDKGLYVSLLEQEDDPITWSTPDGVYESETKIKDFGFWKKDFVTDTQNLIMFLQKWDIKSEYSEMLHTQIGKLEEHISWLEREAKKYE